MSSKGVTVECSVPQGIKVTIDAAEVQEAIGHAIQRELGYVVGCEIAARIQELVREQMLPHEAEIRARIEQQLKDEMNRIVVGRRG